MTANRPPVAIKITLGIARTGSGDRASDAQNVKNYIHVVAITTRTGSANSKPRGRRPRRNPCFTVVRFDMRTSQGGVVLLRVLVSSYC